MKYIAVDHVEWATHWQATFDDPMLTEAMGITIDKPYELLTQIDFNSGEAFIIILAKQFAYHF